MTIYGNFKMKVLTKSDLKNIISDYDNFIKSCEEANRYSGDRNNFIIIGDEILKVVD